MSRAVSSGCTNIRVNSPASFGFEAVAAGGAGGGVAARDIRLKSTSSGNPPPGFIGM
jgi:hypothetical protein